VRETTSVLQLIGNTPLIRLHRIDATLPTPIYAKCEHLNPGGSVKDRIALAMVTDAEKSGLLTPGMTIIEATAGNTGIGLAIVAAARGYHLACVMPEKMSADKRNALRALGATVVITPNAPPNSAENFRNVARRMAAENNWWLADQFNNSANVQIHEQTTGAEILQQYPHPINAFVCGAGTGGTISGVGARLRTAWPEMRVVLADPVGSGLAHWVKTAIVGPDSSYAVEGIGSSEPPSNLHREVIDDTESVTDDESFSMAKRLIREEGLLVGGSSGTNVAAAVRVASSALKGAVITVLPDSWDRYRSTSWMQENQT
jgi:cysteine synthase